MSDPVTPLDGGCLCGAIRYRLSAAPIAYYACHCTDCQRQSGSAFGLSMIVPREAVQITKGTPRAFDTKLADGRQAAGTFCDACATRLWGEGSAYPTLLNLRPGTLDQRGVYTPAAHIWTRSARPWLTIPDGVHFEMQPQDPLELVRIWKRLHGA